MKKNPFLIALWLLLTHCTFLFSQNNAPIHIQFPSQPGWNEVKEGESIEFDVKAIGGTGENFSYNLIQGKTDSMNFDSLGHFSWTPSFEMVDRLSSEKAIQLIFEAKNEKNESTSEGVEIIVHHVNQPPLVGDLKPFYVQYDVINTYKPEMTSITDPDSDPLVFIPIAEEMPEGAKLSEQGEFIWKPSLTQFKKIKASPIYIDFFVEDQPFKSRTKGRLKIEATQLDLPPLITIIPETKDIRQPENATVNLKFYLSDPNGDEDIATFNFISDNPLIPSSSLVKNTSTQYEFIWEPGYGFVKDPLDSITFNVTFFVMDKTQKRNERRIKFTLFNAVNEGEKDKTLYIQYRTALVRAYDLLEQLKEKEKELKKDYYKAKRGKRDRSIANASLGAVTGIVPIVNSIPTTTQRAVSAVGGTTVLTIGTLEATEVIGKSTRDLIDRLNYVMEKKNEIQTKSDIFARKYSLKSSRRRPDFIQGMDDLLAIMNLKGLVALELNAGWQNKNRASDTTLSKTFKDFVPEDKF